MSELTDGFENEMELARLAELQARLAYEAAASLIESYGVPVRIISISAALFTPNEGRWWDVSAGLDDPLASDALEDALEYLELIELLEFHPEHEDWVKVLPMAEEVVQ